MAVLAKLKNFVGLLRAGNTEEIEKENVDDVKKDLDAKAKASLSNPAIKIDDDSAVDDIDEVEDTNELDPVLDELLSLKITDKFSKIDVKKIVKERDMKYFSDLYTTEHALKRTDIKGNQVATAIAGSSMAVYMGVVATSAIALPAVVMGLIGFGIGGGIVYSINKLTGKESLFGHLYRKLKTRFGKVRPSLNIKAYRDEFNEKKINANAIIDKQIDNYIDGVVSAQESDDIFNDYIQTIASNKTPDFKYKDTESQAILERAAKDFTESVKLRAKMQKSIKDFDENIAKQDSFISQMESAKQDVKQIAKESSDNFENLINTVAGSNIVEFNNAINSYITIKSNLNKEIAKIEEENNKSKAKLEDIIASFKSLPNKDLDVYVNAIKKAEEEIDEIDELYAKQKVDAQNKANAEIVALKNDSIMFSDMFDKTAELCNNGAKPHHNKIVTLAQAYVRNKIDTELDSISLDANVKKYLNGYEGTAIISTPLDIDYKIINDKVASGLGRIIPNVDESINSLVKSFRDRNDDIAENLDINFDINIEHAQEKQKTYTKELDTAKIELTDFEIKTKKHLTDLRAQLKAKREEVSQNITKESLFNAHKVNSSFKDFSAEQQANIETEIKESTPKIER